MARRSEFGDSWWAKKWIGVLDSFGWSSRLQRGRSYARAGNVLDIEISPGKVTARVQGSRPRPYTVKIDLKPLADKDWDKAIRVMADQAIFAARLLAGEMPGNIEEAFTQSHLSLFPRSSRDLETNCSCPDWANPCKHIAAVYYVLGQEFDRDPFLIFRLRGRTREEIVQTLRERRAAAADAVRMEQAREAGIPAGDNTQVANAVAGDDASPDDPLERSLGRFWAARDDRLRSLEFSMTRPPVDAGYLRRLGRPRFWPAGEDPHGSGGMGRDFFEVMGQCYRAVAVRALEAAFENSPASTEEPS